jgi:parallel beta-helix repeat protein
MFYLVLPILMMLQSAKATNYYTSGLGNDSNNGLSTTTAFRNIQKAANLVNAGDTVFMMNGTYKSQNVGGDVVYLNRKGSASQWIVFINYPNHAPKIEFNGWGGFKLDINTAYIEINGLEIEGNNKNVKLSDALNQSLGCNNPNGNYQPEFNGNGIEADGRKGIAPNKPHHLRLLNNKIYNCGGGGISLIHTDYVTVKNNVIYNNAWYTVFGSSGISLYQLWDSDGNTTDFKNIVEGNISHHNRLFVPWVFCPCCFSDGNGIIIDDSNNTQNGSTSGIYKGKTLVQNNIVYMNGGSGIHSFESQHITIVNNTAYKNSQTPEIDGGEIFANTSNDIKIVNNILYAETGNVINSNYKNTNIIYDNNLHWNGTKTTLTSSSSLDADPKFVNESTFDFHLKNNSPCIDKGNNAVLATKDFDGNSRPQGVKSDIGAYEFTLVNALTDTDAALNIKVYPNPVSGILYYESSEKLDKITCFTMQGIEIKPKLGDKTIDLSPFTEGVYKIVFYQNNKKVGSVSIVKEN